VDHDQDRPAVCRGPVFRHVQVETEQGGIDAVNLCMADIARHGVRQFPGHGGRVLFGCCCAIRPAGIAARQFGLLDDPIAVAVESFEQRFARQFAWCHPAIAITVDAVEPVLKGGRVGFRCSRALRLSGWA
jgi:hypothetical protein